ncbi:MULTISPECIES: hypothetical protein [Clostridium]|uniref:hypothetical protein n=1 Tax=Clostridium TaxID=1485 RepID=UPI00189A64B6|nr:MULTISPECIES: hypothetical protein [Clostridium]MDI9216732.1 hypothetical protein [Clostridium tertium]
MKNKKLSILLIAFTSIVMIGCSNKISLEDRVIDSVVIDEDAKDTAISNDGFNIVKLVTTENLHGNKSGAMIRNDDKLIEIQYSEDFGENKGTIYQTQFPKLYIDSLEVGTITDDVENDRNVVSWERKEVRGQLLAEYMGTGGLFRILTDNKVYMLDNNYNFKEITAYKKLIEETNGDINRFQQSYDGKLDIYFLDEENGIHKMVLIDTVNDNYYEISGEVMQDIRERQLNILMAEDDKIYISLSDTTNEKPTIIGYFENNKLNTFFDEESTIKVKVTGDVVYSNDNILFSGDVEDEFGVWRYNIKTKQLEKELELKYDYSYFKLNEDKDFVIITNTDLNGSFNMSLARINDNLKISNIQIMTNSILTDITNDNWLSVIGWSNNGNRFYVNHVKSKNVDGGIKIDDSYYEIYEVK